MENIKRCQWCEKEIEGTRKWHFDTAQCRYKANQLAYLMREKSKATGKLYTLKMSKNDLSILQSQDPQEPAQNL